MSVMIVTDSTSDISQEEAGKENISVVPLKTIFGDEEYLEGIDISPEEFYTKMSQSKSLPKSSQPSPFDFEQIFRRFQEAGDQIVAICLGSRFSGTYQSACIAQEKCGGDIRVIDSGIGTVGLRILVKHAIALREAGKKAEEIADAIEEGKKSICFFAAVDTLEYLFRGGRLSRTSAIAGTLLNIKPLICVEDGEIKVIGKAIGIKKAFKELLNLVRSVGGIDYTKPFAIGYTGERDRFMKFEQMCRDFMEGHEPIISSIGSVIGTHAGPGAVAITFFRQ
ncbi:MAG: DegV family protein [Peptococcaceae bacterium]|jgi:DegV family protein with EDD domain|nr:DegV family protein [Peptococcaceae bacterium]